MSKDPFLGTDDGSVIILENMFPESDMVFTMPFEFAGIRSGVYVEGNPKHLDKIFRRFVELVDAKKQEDYFGKWISVTPPGEFMDRVVLHYEALSGDLDKIQILTSVLRKHLVEVCDLRMSKISTLIVRVGGIEIQRSWIVLPEGFINGNLLL